LGNNKEIPQNPKDAIPPLKIAPRGPKNGHQRSQLFQGNQPTFLIGESKSTEPKINIKKGQFLAPQAMRHSVEKF